MHSHPIQTLVATIFVVSMVIAVPVLAEEMRGKIKSIDRTRSEIVVTDEKTERDVTVSLSSLSKGIGKNIDLRDLKTGRRVVVDNTFVAAKIALEEGESGEAAPKMTMLQEFWHNFRHNLFKPLLLFFYLGFLVPILKVEFEFPYVIYQGLTIYLLLAIGWHGGEELAKLN